jgi:hypothetical protein
MAPSRQQQSYCFCKILSDQRLCPVFQDYGVAGQVRNSSSYEMSRILLRSAAESHKQALGTGAWTSFIQR